jgi:hypothetical protein
MFTVYGSNLIPFVNTFEDIISILASFEYKRAFPNYFVKKI